MVASFTVTPNDPRSSTGCEPGRLRCRRFGEPRPKLLFAELGGAHDRVFAIDEPHASRADVGGVNHIGRVDEGDDRPTSGSVHHFAAVLGGRCFAIRTDADEHRVDRSLGQDKEGVRQTGRMHYFGGRRLLLDQLCDPSRINRIILDQEDAEHTRAPLEIAWPPSYPGLPGDRPLL